MKAASKLKSIHRFITIKNVDDQGDRVLLYGADTMYHVIASREDGVKAGDEIEYEPYGWNFGWFIRKVVPKPDWA